MSLHLESTIGSKVFGCCSSLHGLSAPVLRAVEKGLGTAFLCCVQRWRSGAKLQLGSRKPDENKSEVFWNLPFPALFSISVFLAKINDHYGNYHSSKSSQNTQLLLCTTGAQWSTERLWFHLERICSNELVLLFCQFNTSWNTEVPLACSERISVSDFVRSNSNWIQ